MDKIHQVCYALSLNRPTNYLLRRKSPGADLKVPDGTFPQSPGYYSHIQATAEMSLERRG